MRSADDKTSGRVNKKPGIFIQHVLRKYRIKNVFANVFMNLFLGHFRIMLCGKNHRIDPGRFAVLIIFDGHLGFSVRTQIRQGSVLTHFG